MDKQADPAVARAATQPLRLRRLLPPGEPASAAEVVEQLGLWRRSTAPPERQRVILNMVATADGRATLAGRSGPISGPADRELFHALRSAVDAVLVGAGTVRGERYGRIIPSAERRAMRRERGLADEPLACIVSARVDLDAEIPLLREPDARVAILTASDAGLPAARAQLQYVRTGEHGQLDLRAALSELRERFAIETVLCEGGPHLAYQLLALGLLDELFLTVSPTLAGGNPGDYTLRIIAGDELDPPVRLELLGALLGDSQLLLRYGVLAREESGARGGT